MNLMTASLEIDMWKQRTKNVVKLLAEAETRLNEGQNREKVAAWISEILNAADWVAEVTAMPNLSPARLSEIDEVLGNEADTNQVPYKKGQLVKVVKPFYETRTPCPRIGTVGKVVTADSGFVRVAFAEEFTDAHDGATWYPGDGEPMIFKFKPDEIAPVSAAQE